jgi:putative transposase
MHYQTSFVLNAILYVLNTGCQWRQLPREFPHWAAVYDYFYRLVA